MDVRPGIRVRARGLIWDVREAERVNACDRLSLRCAEGDMAGLEWEVYVPPETIEPLDTAFDPRAPAPLPLWRLMHQAHLLNELPAGASFMAHEPGRLKIEPYQLVPLLRALDMPRPRLLLADGVGLGKTIQAGLIAAELIARRRAHRILIVAPSGPLLSQWAQETKSRFGLKFTQIASAAELWETRRAHELGANPFESVALCLTSFDFAKQDHVLEEIERAGWDLVIIDEAHHCMALGSASAPENTHRRLLAEVLARRSDGLLLLTATPHDGHDAHFASLIALLDPSLVDGEGGFAGRDYRRHVIRRLKPHIRDIRTGAMLFQKRLVFPVKVDVEGVEHEEVRAFHRALSAFVVPRLRKPEADDSLAFVSLLKRSVSTISACLATLRVVVDRIARRSAGDTESAAARAERARALRAWRRRVARFGGLSATDEAGQEAVEIESMAASLRAEGNHEAADLIVLGASVEARDPKLAALVLEVRLIRMEHDRANILVYTEYTDSQMAACRALRALDIEVLTIGGQDPDDARAAAADRFGGDDGLILISTDALAEGLNLHRHCFHLIHLDLPYNPNRLEQRNGRIDRYGQRHEPEIRYLYLPGTFEERLLLHLITKYEKARAVLDVMPDTIGLTADQDGSDAPLTGGLSEEPEDLFGPETEAIRTLDRAMGDGSPETVAALLREIDRAYDSFELMAVSHGWFGTRGFSTGLDLLARAEQPSGLDIDLPSFAASVIEAEIGRPALIGVDIQLPSVWAQGFEGLPGFDPGRNILRFTRESGDDGDPSLAFLGRAHPLISRAVRHGCRLQGAVAAAGHDRLGLLLTFEIEIPVAGRVMFRRTIGVIAGPGAPPAVSDDYLSMAVSDARPAWPRFRTWSGTARREAAALVSDIADQEYRKFAARHAASRTLRATRTQNWLRIRTNMLCGAFVPPTEDLFGGSERDPPWRHRDDPRERLAAYAIDPEVQAARRRQANEVLDIARTLDAEESEPGAVQCRPIGMLMLIPNDAV